MNFCLNLLANQAKSLIYKTYVIHCLHICIWYDPKLSLTHLFGSNKLADLLEFDLKHYSNFKTQ